MAFFIRSTTPDRFDEAAGKCCAGPNRVSPSASDDAFLEYEVRLHVCRKDLSCLQRWEAGLARDARGSARMGINVESVLYKRHCL